MDQNNKIRHTNMCAGTSCVWSLYVSAYGKDSIMFTSRTWALRAHVVKGVHVYCINFKGVHVYCINFKVAITIRSS